ncbi:hypothetical protein GOP47_0016868 [Adiantum capillus-veneris]|uniref:E3 ubiquitin protein ligase DRIP2 n=1 Tax=Adiantum capillus-veneris TaxID=13818 RepID=A0A9D4UJE3_ADICA|nr:hypothetical protein GOP47_0016868 [Adiantum capillus-veneris]
MLYKVSFTVCVTVCKDCIYQELDEEESDCCPICNVHLGCSPLEKLRADRQLDDVCAKIFPAKPSKRKVIDEDADLDAPAPAKRKERSLSSLGIGVPPSPNPGFVKRKTKSVTRKSFVTTSKETSTDIESEGKQSDTEKSDVDIETEATGKACAQDTGSTALDENEGIEVLAKKEHFLHGKRETNEAKLVSKLEQRGSSKKAKPRIGDLSTAKNAGSGSTGERQANSVFESLKASSIGVSRAQGLALSDEHRLVSDLENYDIEGRKIPASFAVVRERTGKGVKKRSALAKLAEIAVDQAVKERVKERDPHMFHVPRAPRGRGALEHSKAFDTGEKSNGNVQEKVLSAAVAPVLQTIPLQPLSKSLSDKVPGFVDRSFQERRPVQDATSMLPSKQKERNSGFWFVLQAAESQNAGGVVFPQLSARYLRIKDGKLPVSIVKKYLMKKLHLTSEHEVEITCRGQPVVPNLPLETVRSIWFATMPPSASKKENLNIEHISSTESYGSVEDFLMVLTYGRQQRLPT